MAKSKKESVDKEEGVDLSTAAELWTEEELRAMIREEALKLIVGGQQGTQAMPNTIHPNIYPQPIQWTQSGSINHLNDSGHYHSTYNASEIYQAKSMVMS